MTVKAQLKWTEGMQFIARAGNGPAVVFDSSDGGSGPSPMELVLIGVAGCSAIDVIMIMEKKRAQVTDFQINITGERAEEYPKRYTDIRIEFVLHGKDIKPKAVEQAIQLSETKYCGAMASLNATFETIYRIVDE
ncbi:MAG: OsmC family protein [Desulfobacteraceae bacterium]|jgi:putative redox protein|nr:OsmC family protein [Desulfobacteraceae bacterium]